MKKLLILLSIVYFLVSCDEEVDSDENHEERSEIRLETTSLDFGKTDSIIRVKILDAETPVLQMIENNEFKLDVSINTLDDGSELIFKIDKARFPFGATNFNINLPINEEDETEAKYEKNTLQKILLFKLDVNVEKPGSYADYLSENSLNGIYIDEFFVGDNNFFGTFQIITNQTLNTSIVAFNNSGQIFDNKADKVLLTAVPDNKFNNEIDLVEKTFNYIGEEVDFTGTYYQPQSVITPPNAMIFDGVQTHDFKVYSKENPSEIESEISIASVQTSEWLSPENSVDKANDLIISISEEIIDAEGLYHWAVLASSESRNIFEISNITEGLSQITFDSGQLNRIYEYGAEAELWIISTRLQKESSNNVISQAQRQYKITIN